MTTDTSSRPIAVGDRITHPDFRGAREVVDIRPCKGAGPDEAPHPVFIVPDAGWGTEWVCSTGAERAE